MFLQLRILSSSVVDPDPQGFGTLAESGSISEMDENINKNHQKREEFHDFDHFNLLNLSTVFIKNFVLKCHFRTFKIIFLQTKGRIRNRVRNLLKIRIRNEKFRIHNTAIK
jgi:hypothetical protein